MSCSCKTHSPCSICWNLKCDQLSHKTSICANCRSDDNLLKFLERDEKNRYIDPMLNTPIPTCICGKMILGHTICGALAISGDKSHSHIQ